MAWVRGRRPLAIAAQAMAMANLKPLAIALVRLMA
jgi:hypothetical protein